MNRRLRSIALAFGIVLATPVIAYANYPVVDISAIAKLGEQLSKMQKQIDQLKQHTEWLTKLSAQAQGTIDAIGAAGQIALPILNMQKLTNRIMRDIQCLTPDLSGLMPGLNLDDLDFFSICEGRSIYRKSLWFDPKDPSTWTFPEGSEFEGTNSGSGSGSGIWADPDHPVNKAKWQAQQQARAMVEARREELAKDAVTTGLAQSDLTVQSTEEIQQAIEELEAATNGAADMKRLLMAIAKWMAMSNRQQVQQQQLMAQLVKIQSTMLLQYLPPQQRDGGEGAE